MYIIVAGCGRLGSSLANDLADSGNDVCVIDRSKERLSILGDGFNGLRVAGIEFDKDKLMESGINQADVLFAVTPDDNINITLSLIAKRIYHVPLVVARVNDPNRKYIYNLLQIDTINLVRLGTDMLVNRISSKKCHTVIQLGLGLQILDLLVSRDPKMTIKEIQNKHHCVISAIKRDNQISIPDFNEVPQVGDRIFCTLQNQEKDKLLKTISKELPI